MTYVVKTKYVGDVVAGQRDGVGKQLDADGKEILLGQGSGIFIPNLLEPNGVMVQVTFSTEATRPCSMQRLP